MLIESVKKHPEPHGCGCKVFEIHKKNGVTSGLTAMKEATAKILKKVIKHILLQIQNNIVTKENENRCRGRTRTCDL